jgi:hypothetical protein
MEWNEHTQLRLRIDNLRGKIVEAFPYDDYKGSQARMDLTKIWSGLNSQFKLLDQEAVECRRRNKATPKYTGLRASVESLIYMIDKRVTWGLLL